MADLAKIEQVIEQLPDENLAQLASWMDDKCRERGIFGTRDTGSSGSWKTAVDMLNVICTGRSSNMAVILRKPRKDAWTPHS